VKEVEKKKKKESFCMLHDPYVLFRGRSAVAKKKGGGGGKKKKEGSSNIEPGPYFCKKALPQEKKKGGGGVIGPARQFEAELFPKAYWGTLFGERKRLPASRPLVLK